MGVPGGALLPASRPGRHSDSGERAVHLSTNLRQPRVLCRPWGETANRSLPKRWKLDREEGGGQLWDLGSGHRPPRSSETQVTQDTQEGLLALTFKKTSSRSMGLLDFLVRCPQA